MGSNKFSKKWGSFVSNLSQSSSEVGGGHLKSKPGIKIHSHEWIRNIKVKVNSKLIKSWAIEDGTAKQTAEVFLMQSAVNTSLFKLKLIYSSSRLMYRVMGDGSTRTLECSSPTCHSGLALEQKLLSPVAVVSGSDGKITWHQFDSDSDSDSDSVSDSDSDSEF